MATVALGSDHAGYALRREIALYLKENGVSFEEFGSREGEPYDYPLAARDACRAVQQGRCGKAILVCGTGVGISMAANKLRGIRAACVSDHFSAKYTRLHNDANALCLGGRVIGPGVACELVELFLNTPFEGGRHAGRVALIAELEEQNRA